MTFRDELKLDRKIFVDPDSELVGVGLFPELWLARCQESSVLTICPMGLSTEKLDRIDQ